MSNGRFLIFIVLIGTLNKVWADDLSIQFNRHQPNRKAFHFLASEHITNRPVSIDPVHLPAKLLSQYNPIRALILVCSAHHTHHLLVDLTLKVYPKTHHYILYRWMFIPMFNYESFTILAYDQIQNTEEGHSNTLYITFENNGTTERSPFIVKDTLGKKYFFPKRTGSYNHLPSISPKIHRH
ncbi:hypothetical protein CI610_02455 [invertebrate metagenome]|uniref:Uncharacterized protein n=1 Tax=invertebrate metagenome TaxID=1711999 RepID=A0A2H9T5V5_9ZZZZ